MKPYPKRLFTQYETNVGYYPRRVTAHTSLRSGPGDGFTILHGLVPEQRVAIQSVRNPTYLTNPAIRPARNGYVWVYVLKGGRSGWVALNALGPDAGGWADGPASADFEIGNAPGVIHEPRRKRKPRFRLGKAVSGTRVVKAQEAYLRYAASSAPFYYLQRGDRVRRLWWHPRGYTGIEVIQSSSAPPGTRGWIWSRSLRKP